MQINVYFAVDTNKHICNKRLIALVQSQDLEICQYIMCSCSFTMVLILLVVLYFNWKGLWFPHLTLLALFVLGCKLHTIKGRTVWFQCTWQKNENCTECPNKVWTPPILPPPPPTPLLYHRNLSIEFGYRKRESVQSYKLSFSSQSGSKVHGSWAHYSHRNKIWKSDHNHSF